MEFVRQHRKISIIVLSTLIFVLLISISFGKYIYNVIDSYILETKGMYFNSSVLGVNTKEYRINNWDGVNAYNFTIDLNNRKNSLKKTDSDIEYEINVTCSNTVLCSLSKEADILYKDSETDSYQITLSPQTTFKAGDEVEIYTEVISSYPYKKILSAKYTLAVETSKFSYNIEDASKNNFITLNLTNSVTFYQVETAFGSYSVGDYIGLEDFALLSETDKAKCFSAIVTVNFNPANLQLDMTTNSYLHRLANSQKTVALSGYNYVYEYQFKVPATSSEKIIFYKSDNTQDYSYPNNNNSSAVNVSVKLAGETS